MKYFIDFEATQFSGEIISIGCVNERGESFYSLVAPKKGKITPFITNLTGITAEEIEKAMSVETVFNNFYDWVFKDEGLPQFYCYGNADFDFIYNTSKRAETLKSRMILGYISGCMIDYSHQLKKLLNWDCEHGLLKTYQHFNPEAEQTHNSLDDAFLLKWLYTKVELYTREELLEIFIKWDKNNKPPLPPKWNELNLPAGTICTVTASKRLKEEFKNLEDAAEFIYNKVLCSSDRESTSLERVQQNIKKSIGSGKRRYSRTWRVVK